MPDHAGEILLMIGLGDSLGPESLLQHGGFLALVDFLSIAVP